MTEMRRRLVVGGAILVACVVGLPAQQATITPTAKDLNRQFGEMLAEIKKALRPEGTLVLIDFKRVEGVSPPFILKMVRAGQGTFTDEFVNAGFELVDRNDNFTADNYLMKFRHRRPPAK